MKRYARKPSRAVLITALAAVAVGAGVAVASGATETSGPNLNTPGTTAQSIPGNLTSSFAALRRPRQQSDSLPRSAGTEDEPGGIARHYGVNASLSRRVGSADGMPVWLVPGSTGSCIVLSSGGGACGSNETLLAEGLTVGLVPVSGAATTVIGVVPDGTKVSAAINPAGNDRQAVAVNGNVFSLSGSDAASFTVQPAHGKATTEQLPSPAPSPAASDHESGEAEESPPR